MAQEKKPTLKSKWSTSDGKIEDKKKAAEVSRVNIVRGSQAPTPALTRAGFYAVLMKASRPKGNQSDSEKTET